MRKIVVCVVVALTAISVLACAARTKKGTLCKRAPSPGSEYCWQHGGTTAAQRAAGITAEQGRCKAITNSGSQCSRPAKIGSEYCWQHVGKDEGAQKIEGVANVPIRKDDTVKQPEQSSGQCTATTKKGVRCSRRAKPGSSKCWQHDL